MSLMEDNVSLSLSSLNDYLATLYDADEIKVILYILLQQSRFEGKRFYVTIEQLEKSDQLHRWIGDGEDTNIRFERALNALIDTGTLLKSSENPIMEQPLLFLNDDNGRLAMESLQAGKWRPMPSDLPPARPPSDEINLFQLYEENIGPLTPLLAEDLTAAQEEFPHGWIKDAIHIAVQNNARSWRYIDTILRSWQKEGKHDKPGRDSQTNQRKPAKGKFDDFIQR